jgi:hypothetical protein
MTYKEKVFPNSRQQRSKWQGGTQQTIIKLPTGLKQETYLQALVINPKQVKIEINFQAKQLRESKHCPNHKPIFVWYNPFPD